jgi:putative sterol carrier protein
MSGTLETLGERLPRLFNRGVKLLQERAAGGDTRAAAQLEDVLGARAAVRIVVEGGSELWLAVEEGALRAGAERPQGVPVRLAVAASAEAFGAAFAEVPQGVDEDDGAAVRAARAASERAEAVLEGQRLDFHVRIEGVPELGTAVVKVAVGGDEPPETPTFTATVRYDDLEEFREKALPPQQLLMGGRVRFAGDYVPALQLGMQLAQATGGGGRR